MLFVDSALLGGQIRIELKEFTLDSSQFIFKFFKQCHESGLLLQLQ